MRTKIVGAMDLGRRDHLRVAAIAPLSWTVDGSGSVCKAVTRDWSRGGMFVQTDQPAPRGSRVALRIGFGDNALRVDATVMHRSQAGMGVLLDLTSTRVC